MEPAGGVQRHLVMIDKRDKFGSMFVRHTTTTAYSATELVKAIQFLGSPRARLQSSNTLSPVRTIGHRENWRRQTRD
jgi:hypothetical protein